MERIAIHGTVFVPADERDSLLERTRPLVEAARAEAGCLDYSFLPDPYDPTCVRIIELWENETALRHHFTLPHTAAAGTLIGEVVTERGDISKHLITWTGGVRDDVPNGPIPS